MVMINKRKASTLNKVVSGILALSFALGMTLFAVLPVFNSSSNMSNMTNSTASRMLPKVKSSKEAKFKSLLGQGEMALQAKNWVGAVSFLEQAVKLKNNQTAKDKLASAYLNLGKEKINISKEEAKTWLTKAFQTASPNSSVSLEAQQLLKN